MTEENPRDDDGLGERLRRLLEALDRLEDASERVQAEGEAYGVDVDVDVEFGTLDDATRGGPDRWRTTRRPDRNRSPPTDRSRSEDVEYTVAVREREDGATVAVDLGGSTEAVPRPAVDDGALTLRRRGAVVERVPLPFDDGVVAERSTNNGVLVVTVERVAGDDDGGDRR